jgi:hypothetical protein
MQANDHARLRSLYLATDYCVEDPRLRCVLAVDAGCDVLADWLRAQGYDRAVFITAWNPRSEVRPDAENWQHMRELQHAIADLELPALIATGRSRTDAYAEPSLLVPGLSPALAQTLMQRFGQNACLWFELADGRARLEWQ